MFWLALLLMQPADAIMIRDPYPAKREGLHRVFDCDAVGAAVSYTRAGAEITGSVTARLEDRLVSLSGAQAQIFDQLSSIDGMSVNCWQHEIGFTLLISGTDKTTGETEKLYKADFQPESGFTEAFPFD